MGKGSIIGEGDPHSWAELGRTIARQVRLGEGLESGQLRGRKSIILSCVSRPKPAHGFETFVDTSQDCAGL